MTVKTAVRAGRSDNFKDNQTPFISDVSLGHHPTPTNSDLEKLFYSKTSLHDESESETQLGKDEEPQCGEWALYQKDG